MLIELEVGMKMMKGVIINMTNIEFVEKLLDIKLSSTITDTHNKCNGLRCPDSTNYDTDCETECPHYYFWSKNVDWARVGANLVTMPELSKAFLSSIWGSNKYQTIIAGGRNNDKTHLTKLARQHALELEGWQQLPSIFNTVPFDDLMEILEDALDMGFDVKIVDSVIYYRENSKEEHSFSQHVVQ